MTWFGLKHPLAAMGLAGLAALASASAAHATVISVDFQNLQPFAQRQAVNFNGVEAAAALADPIFAGASTWNELALDAAPNSITDPSFTGLVDSTGAATSIGISFTGTVTSANDTPIDNVGSDAVDNDYFVNPLGTSIAYSISGLDPDTLVALYLYSPNFSHDDSSNDTGKPSRAYTLTANGTPIFVPSGTGTGNNALAYIMTDGNGDISGTWTTAGNEGDWSGFQIGYPVAAVPLPAGAVLFGSGIGLLGLFGVARRRSAGTIAAG